MTPKTLINNSFNNDNENNSDKIGNISNNDNDNDNDNINSVELVCKLESIGTGIIYKSKHINL